MLKLLFSFEEMGKHVFEIFYQLSAVQVPRLRSFGKQNVIRIPLFH